MTAEDEVLAASDRFYAALDSYVRGNPDALPDCWFHGASVTYAHLLGDWIEGWPAIWQRLCADAAALENGSIRVTQRAVHVFDDVAYTVCIEELKATFGMRQYELTAQVSDVYRRVNGRWLIVHRHVNYMGWLRP